MKLPRVCVTFLLIRPPQDFFFKIAFVEGHCRFLVTGKQLTWLCLGSGGVVTLSLVDYDMVMPQDDM